MRKKTVTRFQLAALFLITGLVLFRVFDGPPSPTGTVTLNKIKPSMLKHVAFEVTRPVLVAVEASGSYPSETRTETSELAAYGWILDRDSRQVVWKMQRAPQQIEKTLVTVVDTLQLIPGKYDAYFTSYGNFAGSSRQRQILGVTIGNQWMGDSDNWYMVLRTVPKDDQDAIVIDKKKKMIDEPGLWSTGPVKHGGTKQFVFVVEDNVELEIYSVGEYCASKCDYGAIVDYVSGDTLWQLELTNALEAGGMQENIVFDGDVELNPGTYLAFYESDYNHAFENWVANPPFDPRGWGMTLRLKNPADAANVKEFDPWTQREPIIQISRVGSNREERVSFEVHDTLSVLLYAVGELTSSGSLYDYASLKKVSTGDRVWAMSYLASEPAGGSATNRKEVAVVNLLPDRYELTYQSDASHDYDNFSNGAPDNPERWGVTMFSFDSRIDSSRITVQPSTSAVEHPISSFDFEVDAGQVIFNATQLGNNQSLSQTFTLDGLTIVRIVAVGEISTSGQYDYGWIEDNSNGNIVWEMTRRNTSHAGGDDHNRKFEGLVELRPGNYTAHFKTDFTHAFNDFGEGGPDNPAAWGIRIEKILSND